MVGPIWEDMISLKSGIDSPYYPLGLPRDYRPAVVKGDFGLSVDDALDADIYPLPDTRDREGYHGDRHFDYWLSGLSTRKALLDYATSVGVDIKSYLDFGCASGRVIRHFGSLNPEIETYGCDINRRHVEFCAKFLAKNLIVFQNHSIPTIPMPDSSIDLITAFSVFTHIEALDTAWLMELRRILRPGGIAWITVHSEKKILESPDDFWAYKGIRKHPLFSEFKNNGGVINDRFVFRWNSEKSYSSNTIYSKKYIMERWGRIMKLTHYFDEIDTQDVVILQK